MRRALVAVTLAALMVVVGCKATSDRGGEASPQQGFRVRAPGNVTLRQGETQTVTVTVDRGEYFKQDVELAARVSGQGVTIEPTQAMVRASDPARVSMRLTAAPEAAIGTYRVYVTGTPQQGQPTSVDFEVAVRAPQR